MNWVLSRQTGGHEAADRGDFTARNAEIAKTGRGSLTTKHANDANNNSPCQSRLSRYFMGTSLLPVSTAGRGAVSSETALAFLSEPRTYAPGEMRPVQIRANELYFSWPRPTTTFLPPLERQFKQSGAKAKWIDKSGPFSFGVRLAALRRAQLDGEILMVMLAVIRLGTKSKFLREIIIDRKISKN